jgi:hypothetical protein
MQALVSRAVGDADLREIAAAARDLERENRELKIKVIELAKEYPAVFKKNPALERLVADQKLTSEGSPREKK